MRKLVAYLIMTLDGVVKFDAVADAIGKKRDTEEVLADFFAKVAEEDAMLLGRVTYQDWAGYWGLPKSGMISGWRHVSSVDQIGW